MRAWLRKLLWDWIFSDWAKNCDASLSQWMKQQSDLYETRQGNIQAELSLFMQDQREAFRKDAQKTDHSERRHQEIVDAIKSLKRETTGSVDPQTRRQ